MLTFSRVLLLIAIAVLGSNSLYGCSRPSLQVRLLQKATPQQLKDGDAQVINESNPGAEVTLGRFSKYGKYTVFDFSSPY